MAESLDDEVLLPEADDREWLLDRLHELIAAHGFASFVNAPLITAGPFFFPDPWRGGEASVRRVARRLLHYVGIDATVAVRVYAEEPGRRETPVGKPVVQGADFGVWFVKRSKNEYDFGVEAVAMRDPLIFVPAMARAVAHAWLITRGAKIGDGVAGQRLVDVCTVYLGFGILTADAALRHGAKSAGGFSSTRTTNRLGLVSPRAMAFALGVQASARQLEKRDLKSIAAAMQPNPGAFFRRAATWSATHVDVHERLGIPLAETWPPPPDVDALVAPFDDDLGDDDHEDEERLDLDRGMRDVNIGLPVFRVERSMAGRLSKAIFMGIIFLGGMATRSNMGIDLQMVHVMIAAAILAPSAYVIGRFFDDVRCSDPKCAAPLAAEMTSCPLCGGTIKGVIHHPKERLAAEEALRDSEAPDEAGAAAD